ncbi:hypothetical protein C1Y40_04759 [Mycobacterium talmoniae]|uniref:Uncharacterized protein n=1 Tax=Mycobacterium talmoniae TaxID=1858794 RepID=A0A2S8BEJ5_9MYCO|nr:hypothetical protein C1Y40_04759 [Mycobacterium talmoniae]
MSSHMSRHKDKANRHTARPCRGPNVNHLTTLVAACQGPHPPCTGQSARRGCRGFCCPATGSQLRADVCGRGLGATAGRRVGLGWAGVGIRVSGHLVSGVGRRTHRRLVAGPGGSIDDRGGHPVCDVDAHHRHRGRADRQPSSRGGRGLRGGVYRDGAPAGDRGQPGVADVVGRHQFPWAKHPGDHGHRGALRRDVGPRRRRDVRLRRRLGHRHHVDSIQPGTAKHQPRGGRRPGRRGRSGGQHRRFGTGGGHRAPSTARTGLRNGVG